MSDAERIIPILAEITSQVPAVAPETRVREVVDIFRESPSLQALPVVSAGKFSGVVTRRNLFFRHLGRPFAIDLYKNKPISLLLESEGAVMEPDLDVNTALERLLAADPSLSADSFPVVKGEKCLGIVSVSTLMMKISKAQGELLETLQRLSARIREEVAQARGIQQDLLPPAEARFGTISVSGGVITSSEIGGDFFDYFPLGDSLIGLVVGDVSGHGIQSGMVTTAAKASLHTLVARGVSSPADLLAGMNDGISATARQSLLMTCLIAVIDGHTATVRIANAGHNYPYHYRNATGAVAVLDNSSSYPLGFEEGSTYEEATYAFPPGDALFLYTDGIVEAQNSSGEEFGYHRLEEVLKENLAKPPGAARGAVCGALAAFAGAGSFEDDVSILVATADGNQYGRKCV